MESKLRHGRRTQRRRSRAPGLVALCVLALAARSALAAQSGASARLPATPGPLALGEVIEATLTHNASLALQQLNVQGQYGVQMRAAAAFDRTAFVSVHNEVNGQPLFPSAPGGSVSHAGQTTLGYDVGGAWLFRSGITVTPSVMFARLVSPNTFGDGFNTGVAALTLTVPLMRGRAGGMAAASERAAIAGGGVVATTLVQLRAATVLDVVTAYWAHAGALRTLDVLRESEERAERLLAQTRALIEGEERPAADSIAILANLMAKHAARLAGEDAVTSTRRTLAGVMGIPALRAGDYTGVDAFPATPDTGSVTRWPTDSAWVALALRDRADLTAAELQRSVSSSLRAGAQNETRPRLNLVATTGFTGIETGARFAQYFSSFQSTQRGFRTRIGVDYDLPFSRRAAEGDLQLALAEEQQAKVSRDELRRTVVLDVTAAIELLRRATAEVRSYETAEKLFATALANERDKFRLGSSTLFDIIAAEDNLTNARVSLVGAQRRYATTVVQLQYATGQLRGQAQCDVLSARFVPVTNASCMK